MIAFDNDTKNAYKDYNREIKVCGNLYLANKRVSKNLFNPFNDVVTVANVTYDIKSNSIKVNPSDPTLYYNCVGIKLNTEDILGKTLYISSDFETNTMSSSLRLYSYKNQRVITQYGGKIVEDKSNGKIKFQATIPDTLPSDVDGFTLLIYSNANYQASTDKYSTYKNIMIYTEDCSYEPYGQYINDYNVINTTSNNLLDDGLYTDISNLTYSNNEFTQIQDYANTDYTFKIKGLYNNQTIWEKNINLDYGIKHTYFLYQNDIDTIEMGFYSQTTNTIVRYDVPSNLTNNTNYCISMMFTNVTSGKVSFENLQINSGMTPLPYERHNSTPFRLTEENNCKILSFNIEEKTDAYYSSVPYSTMEIEVDNENGYFTDFDEDNILDYLNKNCCVDLFIKINDGAYHKMMTMNFDKISYSDYDKAKLSFISCLSFIQDLSFRDKDKIFLNSKITYNQIKDYFSTNYNLNFRTEYTHGYQVDINVHENNVKDLQSLLLKCSSRVSPGVDYLPFLLITNYNNYIMTKRFERTEKETILKDYQLERPIIKKENLYDGTIINTSYSSGVSTSQTLETKFTNKIQSIPETIIYYNNEYDAMYSITTSHVSVIGATLVSVEGTNVDPFMTLITVNGNLGDEYTINISKTLPKYEKAKLTNKFGKFDENAKILTLNDTSLDWWYYYKLMGKIPVKFRSYVEARFMALPYLEIGDTISLQTDNGNLLVVITEINMDYSNGLIETIKGYELEF